MHVEYHEVENLVLRKICRILVKENKVRKTGDNALVTGINNEQKK